MKIIPFAHLHNHTEYSLLDGSCKLVDDNGLPSNFIKSIASRRFPALAITDHGNLFGAIEFYKSCTNAGIKPIIGMETYISPKDRFTKISKQDPLDPYLHLTLLACDETGYKNLIELTTLSYLEGFYYKPRIDKEVLYKYREGLICLSGCLKGEIPQAIIDGDFKQVDKSVEEFESIFGKENFYFEIMDHGLAQERKVIDYILELSKKTQIRVVATNDCHYEHREDAYSHDVLLCIGTKTTINAPKRLKFQTTEFYYKSYEEMFEIFKFAPEALKNTIEIVEKCNLIFEFNKLHLPKFDIPPEYTAETFLEKLCYEGLYKRYGKIEDLHRKRLEYELKIIKNLGFASYFLIVWDIVKFAKSHQIPVGPGRGSGGGSLVSYVLEITDICPIKHNLLFERFLNPARREMPDLDIDFADEDREAVIDYLRNKYGAKNVAQIATFGRMQARLCVRDVGRVIEMPLDEVDRIAKLIPFGHDITIYSSLEKVPELKQEYEKNPTVKKLLNIAMKLEGLKRHIGIHAAGLVIADKELTNYLPLAISTHIPESKEKKIITQFDDETLLSLGLLKIDILGLRYLTVIDKTEKAIQQKIPQFKLKDIPFDDKKTFTLLKEANTIGIFQLESSGMRDLLRKLKPANIDDIIALISLYRPGPMGSGMLDEFISRRHSRSKITYDHPLLEDILKETYGIIIYQEQVMKIAEVLANFTPQDADILRKAMGKKIPEEIEAMNESFIKSAVKNGIEKKVAEKIFQKIEHFGGYGFNKSHATAYAYLAYRTAYLKANYPHEYFANLLSSEIGRSKISASEESRLITFLYEAERMNIEVLPPRIEKSYGDFTIEEIDGKKTIRYGLLAIKNVGEAAVLNILQSRKISPFDSFENFLSRIDSRQVNRKVIESLIKAGVFDDLPVEFTDEDFLPQKKRAILIENLDVLMENSIKKIESKQQNLLFELEDEPTINLTTDIEWSEHLLLTFEKDVLGFYISGHPLAKYKKILQLLSNATLDNLPQKGKVRITGVISNIKKLVTRKDNAQWAIINLEDLYGEVKVLIFPQLFRKGAYKLLNVNLPVVVYGQITTSNGNKEIIAEELFSLDEALPKYVKNLKITLKTPGLNENLLKKIRKTIDDYPGKIPVILEIITPHHQNTEKYEILSEITVDFSDELAHQLDKLVGEQNWSWQTK